MERGIVPENNYLTNYIVSNILKRIDLELKNKVRKYLFRAYPTLRIHQEGTPLLAGMGANQGIVRYYSFSRETIVTDTDIGRTIEQIPRKNRPFSMIFNLVILLFISLPAYFALTAKDSDGTLEFPGGEICLVLPICWVLLFAFANRKSVTVTIQNDMISQIVKKGNRVISEEEVEISKVNSAIMRFSTDTVEIGEIERSLGKNRHGITYEEAKFESNKLGHGNGTFRTLEILGELDGKEITLMETKFYDSTGAGQSNAMYASEKVMEELRKIGVVK